MAITPMTPRRPPPNRLRSCRPLRQRHRLSHDQPRPHRHRPPCLPRQRQPLRLPLPPHRLPPQQPWAPSPQLAHRQQRPPQCFRQQWARLDLSRSRHRSRRHRQPHRHPHHWPSPRQSPHRRLQPRLQHRRSPHQHPRRRRLRSRQHRHHPGLEPRESALQLPLPDRVYLSLIRERTRHWRGSRE